MTAKAWNGLKYIKLNSWDQRRFLNLVNDTEIGYRGSRELVSGGPVGGNRGNRGQGGRDGYYGRADGIQNGGQKQIFLLLFPYFCKI